MQLSRDLEEFPGKPRIPSQPFGVGARSSVETLRRLGLSIQKQESSSADITLTVESVRPAARCPLCGRVSHRKHSHYTRILMDLPADGRTVNVHLTVRRFRCTNPDCRRHVFAERFPHLIRPRARRTERLDNLLTRIGVLLGGEAGARLAQDLRAPVSPDTILHLLNVLCPNQEESGRPFWTLTGTTSCPGGRKVATTRPLCTVRSLVRVIPAESLSSRIL